MRRILVAVLLLTIVSAVPYPAHAATGTGPIFVGDGDNAPFGYLPDQIEVTFAIGEKTVPGLGGRPANAELAAFQSAHSLSLAEYISDENVYIFKLPTGANPAATVRAMRKLSELRSVSVVTLGHAADEPRGPAASTLRQSEARGLYSTPNDPYFSQQWNLTQMSASSAWDLTYNSYIVGILDTGINAHEDLYIWGAVNFTDDANVSDNYPGADGHGTPMAGIAGALTNNAKGIAGVMGPNQPAVYNIKVINRNNSTTSTWVTNGINFGKNNGIYVLNLSLNVGCTQGLLDAIQQAWTSWHVVIGSTGNGNLSNFNGLCPAASVYALAVTATDGRYSTDGSTAGTDLRWCGPCGDPPYAAGYGGNYGNPGVDLAAPSTWIRVTNKNGGYSNWSWAGTSGAAAHVSGVVGLMEFKWGLSNPDWIRSKLHATADKVHTELYNYNWGAPGQSAELGFGRVNALRALVP